MASGPSFELEDQTDEDFFDKLVIDDDDFIVPSSSSVGKLVVGIDSDDEKAFANLSIGDDSSGDDAKAFPNLIIGDDSGNAEALGSLSSRDGDGVTAIGSLSIKKDSSGDDAKVLANLSTGEDSGGKTGCEAIGGDGKTALLDSNNEEKSSLLVPSSIGQSLYVIECKNVAIADDFGDAEALGSLSIGEDSRGDGAKVFGSLSTREDSSGDDAQVLANLSIGDDTETEVLNDLTASKIIETEAVNALTERNNSVSGGSGVKEVQWSVFNSDSLHTVGNGFDSNPDLFGEFGDGANAGEIVYSASSNMVSDGDMHKSAYYDNHNTFQSQEGEVSFAECNKSADGHDLNSSQYWENLYPGWKYDQNTGQWYQVDGYNATTNIEESFGIAFADGKSEASYLQQTAQTGDGALPQSGTIENVANWNQQSSTEGVTDWNQKTSKAGDTSIASVSNWNQVSQVNDYPSHMILDPQYPGWYYDTIAQEWRSLDAYILATQSTFQTEGRFNQNDFYNSHKIDPDSKGVYENDDKYKFGNLSNQGENHNHAALFSGYNQQDSNTWQPDSVASSVGKEFGGREQLNNHHAQKFSPSNNISQQKSHEHGEAVSYNEKSHQDRIQGFVSPGNFSQSVDQPRFDQNDNMHTSNHYYGTQNGVSYFQQQQQSSHQLSYAPAAGRSSAGRPSHALAAFGFGGKLIVSKDNNFLGNSSYGRQDPVGASISVLNLMEVVNGSIDAVSMRGGVSDYFHSLCQQAFPGPLTGGNVAIKELNKWIDERIAYFESSDMVYGRGEVLKLLLSLLKIACQHYGKLRSPFGTDISLKESDGPEFAIARLFASAKGNGSQINEYGALANCLQKLPSEEHMRASAAELQTLLVCGRKQEALHCARESQLWGPALVLAAQLGDQFYADTVKQMALCQLVAGSPLRTLCLLIAGQPAELFPVETGGAISSVINNTQPPAHLGTNAMLDAWEENLAVITANRTKDDELVLMYLGDSLWKERNEIIGANICYLIAEANFEPYSDSARLCLLGADHFKYPRTYVSPEAIQRTEIYEYSKLLGNSQFILLPFQPYKVVYAYMLAEVGRVSDSLKYCQAVTKSLKTGRAPEVETWRQLASSLEERIKTHQQGGFSTNLAPAKLVGKLLNLFDNTAHRVVGGLPPPAPLATVDSLQANEHYTQSIHRVSASQSAMAMSTLMPSTSMEPIATVDSLQASEHYIQSSNRVSASQSAMAMSTLMPSTSMGPLSKWTTDSDMAIPNRSVSESDIGRNPRQDQGDSSKDANATDSQGKASVSGGTSRFGRFSFGSQLLQKFLKPRQDKQAKLGEANKFYYDEKLKRWVEEGVDPPAEEAALPPPPTTAAFPSRTSEYNVDSAPKTEGALSNGRPEFQSPTSTGHGVGSPPVPPTSNQFSAHGRMGIRSRYVDTFNKGGGNPTNLFQAPSVPSNKPKSNTGPKFFVPTPAPSTEQPVNAAENNIQQAITGNENPVVSSINNSFQSVAPPPSHNMQKFPSMNNISNKRTTTIGSLNGNDNVSLSSQARRAASWSGISGESSSHPSRTEMKPLGDALDMRHSSFVPNGPASTHSSVSGGSYGGDLHEVEL